MPNARDYDPKSEAAVRGDHSFTTLDLVVSSLIGLRAVETGRRRFTLCTLSEKIAEKSPSISEFIIISLESFRWSLSLLLWLDIIFFVLRIFLCEYLSL